LKTPSNCSLSSISVAARTSPLSRAQVKEVEAELGIALEPIYIESYGDLDRKTSLRDLGKTDFFTCQIDEAVLEGRARIAIHSAKDLPETLPPGLALIAITKGVDPSDSIVIKDELPFGSKVGTSSKRREDNLLNWRPDIQCVDIRGTIHERLALLSSLDGVIIAEAALIRLGLTHLNRIPLPGPAAPLQGQLAVVARADDREIASFFSLIHSDL
jgi:hydroxymethylbilane synthase